MFLLVEIPHEPLQSCSSENVSDKNIYRSTKIYFIWCLHYHVKLLLCSGEADWIGIWEKHILKQTVILCQSLYPMWSRGKAFLYPPRIQQMEAIPQEAPQNCICTEPHTAAATPCSCIQHLRLCTNWTHIKQFKILSFPMFLGSLRFEHFMYPSR